MPAHLVSTVNTVYPTTSSTTAIAAIPTTNTINTTNTTHTTNTTNHTTNNTTNTTMPVVSAAAAVAAAAATAATAATTTTGMVVGGGGSSSSASSSSSSLSSSSSSSSSSTSTSTSTTTSLAKIVGEIPLESTGFRYQLFKRESLVEAQTVQKITMKNSQDNDEEGVEDGKDNKDTNNNNNNDNNKSKIHTYPFNNRPYAYGCMNHCYQVYTPFINRCTFDPLAISSHWIAWLRGDKELVLYDRRKCRITSEKWWLDELRRWETLSTSKQSDQNNNYSSIAGGSGNSGNNNGESKFLEDIRQYITSKESSSLSSTTASIPTQTALKPCLQVDMGLRSKEARKVRVIQVKISPIMSNLIAVITNEDKLVVFEISSGNSSNDITISNEFEYPIESESINEKMSYVSCYWHPYRGDTLFLIIGSRMEVLNVFWTPRFELRAMHCIEHQMSSSLSTSRNIRWSDYNMPVNCGIVSLSVTYDSKYLLTCHGFTDLTYALRKQQIIEKDNAQEKQSHFSTGQTQKRFNESKQFNSVNIWKCPETDRKKDHHTTKNEFQLLFVLSWHTAARFVRKFTEKESSSTDKLNIDDKLSRGSLEITTMSQWLLTREDIARNARFKSPLRTPHKSWSSTSISPNHHIIDSRYFVTFSKLYNQCQCYANVWRASIDSEENSHHHIAKLIQRICIVTPSTNTILVNAIHDCYTYPYVVLNAVSFDPNQLNVEHSYSQYFAANDETQKEKEKSRNDFSSLEKVMIARNVNNSDSTDQNRTHDKDNREEDSNSKQALHRLCLLSMGWREKARSTKIPTRLAKRLRKSIQPCFDEVHWIDLDHPAINVVSCQSQLALYAEETTIFGKFANKWKNLMQKSSYRKAATLNNANNGSATKLTDIEKLSDMEMQWLERYQNNHSFGLCIMTCLGIKYLETYKPPTAMLSLFETMRIKAAPDDNKKWDPIIRVQPIEFLTQYPNKQLQYMYWKHQITKQETQENPNFEKDKAFLMYEGNEEEDNGFDPRDTDDENENENDNDNDNNNENENEKEENLRLEGVKEGVSLNKEEVDTSIATTNKEENDTWTSGNLSEQGSARHVKLTPAVNAADLTTTTKTIIDPHSINASEERITNLASTVGTVKAHNIGGTDQEGASRPKIGSNVELTVGQNNTEIKSANDAHKSVEVHKDKNTDHQTSMKKEQEHLKTNTSEDIKKVEPNAAKEGISHETTRKNNAQENIPKDKEPVARSGDGRIRSVNRESREIDVGAVLSENVKTTHEDEEDSLPELPPDSNVKKSYSLKTRPSMEQAVSDNPTKHHSLTFKPSPRHTANGNTVAQNVNMLSLLSERGSNNKESKFYQRLNETIQHHNDRFMEKLDEKFYEQQTNRNVNSTMQQHFEQFENTMQESLEKLMDQQSSLVKILEETQKRMGQMELQIQQIHSHHEPNNNNDNKNTNSNKNSNSNNTFLSSTQWNDIQNAIQATHEQHNQMFEVVQRQSHDQQEIRQEMAHAIESHFEQKIFPLLGKYIYHVFNNLSNKVIAPTCTNAIQTISTVLVRDIMEEVKKKLTEINKNENDFDHSQEKKLTERIGHELLEKLASEIHNIQNSVSSNTLQRVSMNIEHKLQEMLKKQLGDISTLVTSDKGNGKMAKKSFSKMGDIKKDVSATKAIVHTLTEELKKYSQETQSRLVAIESMNRHYPEMPDRTIPRRGQSDNSISGNISEEYSTLNMPPISNISFPRIQDIQNNWPTREEYSSTGYPSSMPRTYNSGARSGASINFPGGQDLHRSMDTISQLQEQLRWQNEIIQDLQRKQERGLYRSPYGREPFSEKNNEYNFGGNTLLPQQYQSYWPYSQPDTFEQGLQSRIRSENNMNESLILPTSMHRSVTRDWTYPTHFLKADRTLLVTFSSPPSDYDPTDFDHEYPDNEMQVFTACQQQYMRTANKTKGKNDHKGGKKGSNDSNVKSNVDTNVDDNKDNDNTPITSAGTGTINTNINTNTSTSTTVSTSNDITQQNTSGEDMMQPFLYILKLREIGYEGLIITVLEQIDLLTLFENGFVRDSTRNQACIDWKMLQYLLQYLCAVLKNPKLVAWNSLDEQKCSMIVSWLIILVGGILKYDTFFAIDKCVTALQLVRSSVSYCFLINRYVSQTSKVLERLLNQVIASTLTRLKGNNSNNFPPSFNRESSITNMTDSMPFSLSHIDEPGNDYEKEKEKDKDKDHGRDTDRRGSHPKFNFD